MFQKKLNQSGQGTSEVNLTPLIDISLVLVVILLLATPLALESMIGVRKSQSSGQTSAHPKNDSRIELCLVSEDVVEINHMAVPRTDLAEALPPLLEESVSRRVVVACADGVSHGAFVNVLDLAKLSGAGEIAIMDR